jgi:hypothetical protein
MQRMSNWTSRGLVMTGDVDDGGDQIDDDRHGKHMDVGDGDDDVRRLVMMLMLQPLLHAVMHTVRRQRTMRHERLLLPLSLPSPVRSDTLSCSDDDDG